jgi:hypothetical protein
MRSAAGEWAITSISLIFEHIVYKYDIRGDLDDPRIHVSGEHSLASMTSRESGPTTRMDNDRLTSTPKY